MTDAASPAEIDTRAYLDVAEEVFDGIASVLASLDDASIHRQHRVRPGHPRARDGLLLGRLGHRR
jgi:hypothetical protein